MFIALSLATAYLLLLGVVLLRRTHRNPAEHWLIVYCAYSAVLMGLHALILDGRLYVPPPLSADFLLAIGFTISLSITTGLVLAYLEARPWHIALVGVPTAVWNISLIVVQVLGLPPLTSLTQWLDPVLTERLTPVIELAAAGWLVLSIFLLIMIWRAYLREPLPLYANRVLFWVVLTPLLLFGDALSSWLVSTWHSIGYGLRFAGAVAAVYSVVVLHLVDLREFARRLFSAAVMTLLLAAVVFGAITLPEVISFPGITPAQRWLLRVLTAIVAASMIVPITQFIQWGLRRILGTRSTDPAEVVRLYGERIGGIVELEELAEAISEAIQDLLGVRRAQLILATQGPTSITLEQVGKPGAPACFMMPDSPIHEYFVENRRALLQYVIDYDALYASAPEAERHYFSDLGMDIYAPIIVDNRLAGVLAVGPKKTDNAFRTGEIELLEALASQTVAALENARLVADLRDLNERITMLNQDLRLTNERLERLDQVKSDFLVIASHELRTPLTQLQGNIEMLLELAEQDQLEAEKDDALDMIRALSRATQRMTQVVVAMLDVTHVDIESIDLVFTPVEIKEVVACAVETFASAFVERKQQLVTSGLESLPTIAADRKRLIQVFENVINNAIKYTPDGGKIEISGKVYDRNAEGKPKSVEIRIKDSGIGIDANHHKLIFEKFYRVDPVTFHSTGTTKFKGAGPGLGLAIAKAIVEGHDGRIWVESPGCDEKAFPGSTFCIILPLNPPAIDARKRLRQVQVAQHDTEVRTPSDANEDVTLKASSAEASVG